MSQLQLHWTIIILQRQRTIFPNFLSLYQVENYTDAESPCKCAF